MIDGFLASYSLNYYAVPLFFVALGALAVGTIPPSETVSPHCTLRFFSLTAVVWAWSISLIFLLPSPAAFLGGPWTKMLLLFIRLIPSFLYLFVSLMNEIVYRERYYLTESDLGEIIEVAMDSGETIVS